MPADRDGPHPQHLDRVLDGRRHRIVTALLAGQRHQVAHVAHDEQVPGAAGSDHRRDDPGVGAGEEELGGVLPLTGEPRQLAAHQGRGAVLEGADAPGEFLLATGGQPFAVGGVLSIGGLVFSAGGLSVGRPPSADGSLFVGGLPSVGGSLLIGRSSPVGGLLPSCGPAVSHDPGISGGPGVSGGSAVSDGPVASGRSVAFGGPVVPLRRSVGPRGGLRGAPVVAPGRPRSAVARRCPGGGGGGDVGGGGGGVGGKLGEPRSRPPGQLHRAAACEVCPAPVLQCLVRGVVHEGAVELHDRVRPRRHQMQGAAEPGHGEERQLPPDADMMNALTLLGPLLVGDTGTGESVQGDGDGRGDAEGHALQHAEEDDMRRW